MARGAVETFMTKMPEKPRTHYFTSACIGITTFGRKFRTWCFSDRASWIDYILITNLMHWLLFIH